MTKESHILYNSKACPFAARTVIAFLETGHPYEEVKIDLAVPRPEWYLKDVNPFGQVPALQVGKDGPIILESLISAEYVADLHPESGLVPADALQRAQIRYFIHNYASRTQAAYFKAAFNKDEAETENVKAALIAELEKVDALLVKQKQVDQGPYFLGSKFTLADLAIAPFLVRLFLAEEYQGWTLPTAKENPNLARFYEWKEALVSRPSVVEASPTRDELIALYQKYRK